VLNRNGLVFVVTIKFANLWSYTTHKNYYQIQIFICKQAMQRSSIYQVPDLKFYLTLFWHSSKHTQHYTAKLYGWYCCFCNCLVYRTRESFVGSMFLLMCVPVYCYLMCNKIKSMTICWSRVVVQNRVYLMSKISNWTGVICFIILNVLFSCFHSFLWFWCPEFQLLLSLNVLNCDIDDV
jgi:hypothetical protein